MARGTRHRWVRVMYDVRVAIIGWSSIRRPERPGLICDVIMCNVCMHDNNE